MKQLLFLMICLTLHTVQAQTAKGDMNAPAGKMTVAVNHPEEFVAVTLDNNWTGKVTLKLMHVSGFILRAKEINKTTPLLVVNMSTKDLPAGKYQVIAAYGKKAPEEILVAIH